MPVLAHAAHWITYVLFLGPTLGFILWLIVITVRDRPRAKGVHDEQEMKLAEDVREHP